MIKGGCTKYFEVVADISRTYFVEAEDEDAAYALVNDELSDSTYTLSCKELENRQEIHIARRCADEIID